MSVFKTPGNFNNHIGLPLSLANMPLKTTHAVYELGMDGAGQLKELTSWLRPHIAIITTAGMAHMKGRIHSITPDYYIDISSSFGINAAKQIILK